MRLLKELIKKTFYVSFVFLLFSIFVSGYFILKMKYNSYKKDINLEASSAAAVIKRNYYNGNLIELRANLNIIAITNQWQQADFVGANNESIWNFENKDNLVSTNIESFFWFFVSDSAAEESRIEIKKSVVIDFLDNSELGKLIVVKNLTAAWAQEVQSIYVVFLWILLFWLVFLLIAALSFKSSLNPLKNIIESINKEAKSVDLLLTKDPHQDELWNIQNWFFILTDKWKSEQESSLKNARNSAIAATVQMLAHDVRKPFTMLQSTLDVLSRCPTPEEFLKKSEFLVADIQKAYAITQALLTDILEINSLKQNTGCRYYSANALVEKSVSDFKLLYPDTKVTFKIDLQSSMDVFVNPDKIFRVLINLLCNAVEAMQNAGDIWLQTSDEVEDEIKYVKFCVGNSNSFIENNDLFKIFDTFFTKNKSNGTGLGLAIVKKFIEEHNGKIWCRSQKDLGVEFFFIIPAKVKSARPKVAIIDDVAVFLMDWRDGLSSEVDVLAFQSPEEFLNHLQEEPLLVYELEMVITDFLFENSAQNGNDLAEILKIQNPNLPVILSSDISTDQQDIVKTSAFKAVIGKDPKNWSELKHYLNDIQLEELSSYQV